MKDVKKWGIYLICPISCFYILPMLIRDTGSAMFILLGAVPILCFANGLYYGVKENKAVMYSLLVGILFLPTIYLFYNSSAIVYTVIFALLSFAGAMIGKGIRWQKR
ncbi:MAG: hypothetical protein ACLRVU_02005 [Beduini sp.]|uniref:hypothetical protein n=1 Tax=Beduini sp. TaxID=1922300 RepID=UPI0039A13E2A